VALALLAAASLVVGCRGNNSQREIYVRELRQQEDEIYKLEDYLAEYQQIIKQQRLENARLRKQLSEKKNDSSPTNDAGNGTSLFGAGGERRGASPRVPRPTRGGAVEPDNDGLPEIDLGDPVMPEIDLGDPVSPEELGAPEPVPIDVEGARPLLDGARLVAAHNEHEFKPPPPPAEPAESVAIYAEQAPTEAGGDVVLGLLAIVEPLRRNGHSGEFHGDLSLLVRDPLADADEPELARWDLDAEGVESAWRDTSRRVLDFALAMPEGTPVGRPLELWVRLAPQGREKILSHTMIELAQPKNLVGIAASGVPSRLHPGDNTRQTSWVASAPRDAAGAAIEQAGWQTASQPPPAPRPAAQPASPPMPLRAPTWRAER
jgi:hypothetical protein